MSKKEKKSDDSIKDLKIDANTSNRGRDIAKFMPIVEMIARKEVSNMAGNMISYDELVNTGLIAINKLIESVKNKKDQDTEYNSSYIAQSVKWAMKDEMRSRQSWYGVKRTEPTPAASKKKKKTKDSSETTEIKNVEDARKAVFEVIMSVESMYDDSGFSPEDKNSPEYLEHLELLEMKESLKKSINKLPDNLRKVIEMRFYQDMSGNEAAEALGVTPSRISHMINEAVKKLKVLMVGEGYKD